MQLVRVFLTLLVSLALGVSRVNALTIYSVQQFLSLYGAGPPQCGVTGSTPKSLLAVTSDGTLQFVSGASQSDIDAVTSAWASFDQNQTAPAAPNPQAFFASIQADSTLTDSQKGILSSYYADLSLLLQNGMAAQVKTVWTQIVSLYGPSGTQGAWLTTTMQSTMQGYATAAGFSLN